MRILYVVQRYGDDIAGGAEQHVRAFAERLVDRGHKVTVLTTCASSYVDWANTFPRGWTRCDGVAVYRAPVARVRNPNLFGPLYNRVLNAPSVRPLSLQRNWMAMQGPESPALVTWLRRNVSSFDVVVFVTYLYWPAWAGLSEVAGVIPTLLHPTAHDEPPMRLSIYQEVLHAPDNLVFLTPEESDLVHERFPGSPSGAVVGIGVDLDRPSDPAAFRTRFSLGSDPYLLYVGRVDPAKGVAELLDFFVTYKERNRSDLRIVLLGEQLVDVPKRSDIVVTGFVEDATRDDALAGALALVHPSYFESFAMVLTEAFAHRRPALVQGRCAVLAGHARRSGAALPYSGFAEFEVAVDLLRESPERADAMGEAGRRYVEREYDWNTVLARYERLLESTVQAWQSSQVVASG